MVLCNLKHLRRRLSPNLFTSLNNRVYRLSTGGKSIQVDAIYVHAIKLCNGCFAVFRSSKDDI